MRWVYPKLKKDELDQLWGDIDKFSRYIAPSGFGYHWNHSGESHYKVGDAMGKAMVKLLKK